MEEWPAFATDFQEDHMDKTVNTDPAGGEPVCVRVWGGVQSLYWILLPVYLPDHKRI